MLKKSLRYTLALLIGILLLLSSSFSLLKRRLYAGPISDHFNGKIFLFPGGKRRSLTDFLKWIATREPEPWPKSVTNPNTGKIQTPSSPDKIVATFVNHSTYFIQWRGLCILTDPIWSLRASPFKWTGPKRVHPPGIALDDLPHIDLILISHNHYDHLDIPTLKTLCKKYKPLILTGLGNGSLLKSHGISNFMEMDWWQSALCNELSVTFTPAKHFSGRWPWDLDQSLFGSFVLSSENKQLFFAGDTGLGPHFKKIADHFNNIELAFLPIGAFLPRWFMQPAHLSPKDALLAHIELKAKTSLAMHFGTFPLSDEGKDIPEKTLIYEMEQLSIPMNKFRILKPGESLII